MKQNYETWFEQMKQCAESISKNAESIVGDEQYLKSVTVTIYLEPGEQPTINVSRDFIPEGYMKLLRRDV
jgi:hypothetical protein